MSGSVGICMRILGCLRLRPSHFPFRRASDLDHPSVPLQRKHDPGDEAKEDSDREDQRGLRTDPLRGVLIDEVHGSPSQHVGSQFMQHVSGNGVDAERGPECRAPHATCMPNTARSIQLTKFAPATYRLVGVPSGTGSRQIPQYASSIATAVKSMARVDISRCIGAAIRNTTPSRCSTPGQRNTAWSWSLSQ